MYLILSITTFSLQTLDALTEYISYARANIHPKINDEAAAALTQGYVTMRRFGSVAGRKVISATTRQLESLIRVSESLARMRYVRALHGWMVLENRQQGAVACCKRINVRHPRLRTPSLTRPRETPISPANQAIICGRSVGRGRGYPAGSRCATDCEHKP